MRFRKLALPSALLPALLLSLLLTWPLGGGCSWFSPDIQLRVQVPQAPEHWRQAFPELRWFLACPDGGLCDLTTLRLPKRVNWPVLAYPWARGRRLPPAGGLYPLDLNGKGDTLVLCWEHGPAAEVFQALARQGVDASRVNAPRLVEEMLACSGGDPRCLDLAFLAGRLASGELRVTDLRLLPVRDLRLERPPGTWFLESPFRPAQVLEAGQTLLLPAVPLGRHHLFAVQPPESLALYVGEKELLWLEGPDAQEAGVDGHDDRAQGHEDSP